MQRMRILRRVSIIFFEPTRLANDTRRDSAVRKEVSFFGTENFSTAMGGEERDRPVLAAQEKGVDYTNYVRILQPFTRLFCRSGVWTLLASHLRRTSRTRPDQKMHAAVLLWKEA